MPSTQPTEDDSRRKPTRSHDSAIDEAISLLRRRANYYKAKGNVLIFFGGTTLGRMHLDRLKEVEWLIEFLASRSRSSAGSAE